MNLTTGYTEELEMHAEKLTDQYISIYTFQSNLSLHLVPLNTDWRQLFWSSEQSVSKTEKTADENEENSLQASNEHGCRRHRHDTGCRLGTSHRVYEIHHPIRQVITHSIRSVSVSTKCNLEDNYGVQEDQIHRYLNNFPLERQTDFLMGLLEGATCDRRCTTNCRTPLGDIKGFFMTSFSVVKRTSHRHQGPRQRRRDRKP